MSKKKGMFSWLGLGGKQEQEVELSTDDETSQNESVDSASEASEQVSLEQTVEHAEKKLETPEVTIANALPEPEPQP